MKRLFFLFLLMPGILFAQKEEHYLAGAVPKWTERLYFLKQSKPLPYLRNSFTKPCYPGQAIIITEKKTE